MLSTASHKSTHGGAGRGQGPKPKWNTTPTNAIRVPEEFIPDLLEIARAWDEGKNPKNVIPLNDIRKLLAEALEQPNNNGSRVKRKVREALELLAKIS